MATLTWKNASNGNWNTGSNWSTGGLPTSADVVTIGFGSSTSSSFSVTQNAASAAASSLTINGDTSAPTSHSVTLLMVGNTLTVTKDLTLSNDQSFISGTGTLSVGGTITGSGGMITATGGILSLMGAGSLGGTLKLAIGTASASTLEIGLAGGASVDRDDFSISDADQTLKINTKFTITGGSETFALGTIQLAGGSLTNTSGLTLNSGKLTGYGTVTASTSNSSADFDGAGTVIASGGVLTFSTRASSNSATDYRIADVSGSTLKFNSLVGSSATVTFEDVGATGGSGILDLSGTSLSNFTSTVKKFIIGNGIKVANADHVTLTGSGTTLNVYNAANGLIGSIKLGESHTGYSFFVDTATDTITTNMPCFAAGTRIATPTGERTVQSLAAGDIVFTLVGEALEPQPIRWVGHRRIERALHPRPETVAPVRILRGAFGEGMPHADLLVSPDHAVFVDGKLICARQLINETTIRQERDWTAVEYFHIELEAHGILLSEGLPTESYLNTGNHGFFSNSDEPLQLHPDLTDESWYPTREEASCAPFVWDEASVRPVWQRLADRAAQLGVPVATPDTTSDPEITLLAQGREIRPLRNKEGLFIFALPHGTEQIRLVSRAAAPTETRPWLEDRRRLGVYVERMQLRGAVDVHPIPLDHPGLSDGWWSVERHGTAVRRWTDGDAVICLPKDAGPAMLEVQIGATELAYVTASEQRRAA